MPVSNSILFDLYTIYLAAPNAPAARADYFVGNRAKFKFYIDLIWEQLTFNILGVKPHNALEALFQINQMDRRKLKREDVVVLSCLKAVLRQYRIFSDKEYIDRAKTVDRVLLGTLRDLCLALAAHSQHQNDSNASMLSDLLSNLKL